MTWYELLAVACVSFTITRFVIRLFRKRSASSDQPIPTVVRADCPIWLTNTNRYAIEVTSISPEWGEVTVTRIRAKHRTCVWPMEQNSLWVPPGVTIEPVCVPSEEEVPG